MVIQPAFEEVLQRSVLDSHQNRTTKNAANASRSTPLIPTSNNHVPSTFKVNGIGSTNIDDEQTGMVQWAQKQELKRRIAEMDADILGLKESIKSLNTQLLSKQDQREIMVRMLRDIEKASYSGVPNQPDTVATGSGVKGKGRAGQTQQGINYMDGEFAWMGGLKARMRNVFGINEFRLCQRGYVLFEISAFFISCFIK